MFKFFILLLFSSSFLFAQERTNEKPLVPLNSGNNEFSDLQKQLKTPTKKKIRNLPKNEDDSDKKNVRVARPFSLSLAILGKHPIAGAAVDFQLFKNLGLGTGASYFSVGSVTGYFIPIYLRGSILDHEFTPYIDFGLDFVSVKFQSTNSLLRSSFQGTQVIVGGGLEYRFRFGLVTRINAIYFANAKIVSPGAEVGYCFAVN